MKYQVQISYTNPAHDHVTLRRRVETITRLVEASTEGEALNRAANQQRALGFIIREAKVIESAAKKEKEQLEEVQLNEEVEQVKEGAKEDAAELLGGPVKTKPKMPPGKRSPGSRYVRGLARKAMKAGMKKEEVEQVDEAKLNQVATFVPLKKHIENKSLRNAIHIPVNFVHGDKSHKEKLVKKVGAEKAAMYKLHGVFPRKLGEEIEQVDEVTGYEGVKDRTDMIKRAAAMGRMGKNVFLARVKARAAEMRKQKAMKAGMKKEEVEQIDEITGYEGVKDRKDIIKRAAAMYRMGKQTFLDRVKTRAAEIKKEKAAKAVKNLAKEEVGADKRDAGYKMSPAVRKAQAESDRLSKVEKPVQAGTLAAQRRREAMKKEEVNLSEQEVINNKKSKAADTAKKMVNAAKGKMNKINLDPKVDTDNQKTQA